MSNWQRAKGRVPPLRQQWRHGATYPQCLFSIWGVSSSSGDNSGTWPLAACPYKINGKHWDSLECNAYLLCECHVAGDCLLHFRHPSLKSKTCKDIAHVTDPSQGHAIRYRGSSYSTTGWTIRAIYLRPPKWCGVKVQQSEEAYEESSRVLFRMLERKNTPGVKCDMRRPYV